MTPDLDIRKITRTIYVTPDGMEHPSKMLAEHHLLCQDVKRAIVIGLELADEAPDNRDHVAAHIIYMLCSGGNRDQVRALLAKVEKMEKSI